MSFNDLKKSCQFFKFPILTAMNPRNTKVIKELGTLCTRNWPCRKLKNTVTQLQFADTKSNKKLPNKPAAAFVSKVYYISYKVLMHACLFLLAQMYF